MNRKNLRHITPPSPFDTYTIPAMTYVDGAGQVFELPERTRTVMCSNRWAGFMMRRDERAYRLATWLPIRLWVG